MSEEWTPALLKAHFDELMHERDRRYGEHWKANEKEAEMLRESLIAYKASQNEWGTTVSKINETMIRRTEVEALFNGLRDQMRWVIGTAITLLIAVVAFFARGHS